MSVAYIIEFRVKSEERQRFLDLLAGVIQSMQAETAYVCATLHVDPADPRRFLLHEIWRDHDDVINIQLHRSYRREWHAALPELLMEDRRITIWTPLALGSMELP
jgi:quinol monooxygenase YgiN